MRLSLAGDVTVVLVALATSCPAARASAFAPGSIPLEHSSKMGLWC